ncbi:DNA translocase FtsK [Hymenobacter sp. BT188]|uniref:FtsK/SpoIIIE domain-containing protein n=1 Tax=Hymenobacter sp. BT188 TaxID=2763504 RepID=UPI001651A9B4|nr:FtsK/SpoIIIE domain-containing protein [Hymenobacter sp. BT188]MBC6606954.1 DNA translocase FtsK [Hymenobacter sp. BT188]
METTLVSEPITLSLTLTPATLIGHVAALYLAKRLRGNEGETGTARFILDQLKGEQMAAIARAVLDDEYLAPRVKIQLPQGKVAPYAREYNLPDDTLTTLRATFLRNAQCELPALLLANTGDDEAQSLQLIEPIGSTALLAQAPLWVEVAAQELGLSNEQLEVWARILRALMELNIRSLPHIAEYVLRTRQEIALEGHPLLQALGAALPALAIPRDTQLFVGLPEKFHTQASRWKALFAEVQKKRASYLRKITPTQALLTAANLRNSFKNVRDAIPESHYDTIEAFITSDGQWNEAAKELAEFEWEVIKPLFDGLRREKLNLGQLTTNFFDERDPDLLSKDERAYLEGLTKRNPSTATDEDRQFYELHRHQISDSRLLKAAWDKFAFGRPQENEDFLAGLALCLERLTVEDNSTNRILKVRLDAKTKGDFRKLNVEAGVYFATRYKGLPALLGSNVVWEVGELWNFPSLVEDWKKQSKYSRNRSEAKAALQLKFTLELQMDSVTQTGQASGHTTSPTQLIWTFSPNKVTREFAGDWERLTSHPLVQCRVGRETVSAKGRFQSVNINDVRTLTPAFGQNRGSFVSTYKGAENLATKWETNLKEARREELISQVVEQELKGLWSVFKSEYSQAIVEFSTLGLASPKLLTQVQAYAALLTSLCQKALGDKNRTLLLQPLLRIGSVTVQGDTSSEIIAPWHPLRMAAMAIKAQRVGTLIKDYLTKKEVRFGDAGRLYFKDLRDELAHAFYPEVVLGRYESRPELLALVDTCGDYTLHESPVAGLTETSDNPAEASKRVAELVDRYLTLQPHESANLSVVLYNCDSARLPQAVVDRIGAMHEEDEDVRCQIVLRHNDPSKLHPLYERIVEASDTDPDAYSTSEATRDFMARLRIGISADQAPAPNEQEGRPNDIVFLQDVIARHATVEWHKENAQIIPLQTLVPAQWSRRRPAPSGDMKSVVYLCCPAQSAEGWAYLTAITSFLRGNWDGDTTQRLLPARQLDFQDPEMSHIFNETHNLGNWVVNYDELLDRRQLIDRKISVIRYKQSTTQGRSLIVSSTASLGLLRSMVQRRISSLHLEMPKEAQLELTEQFIQDANKISGDIVLRAARRGRSASELMGVVLSSYLIRHEMQEYGGSTGGYFGWYFLDDYAEWLGQREEQLADILMLSPSRGESGELRLTIIVSEAKFIDRGGLIAGSRNSRNQLRDTLKRMHEALFETPARLDRTLWLARLSDLILDGVQFPAGANINLADWRMAIRRGECQISLRGYSHVFVSGPDEDSLDVDFSTITEVENAYQEVFSWDQVRDLVTLYSKNGNPMPLRRLNRDTAIWEVPTFVKPPSDLETTPTITIATVGSASLPTNETQTGVQQAGETSSVGETLTSIGSSTEEAPLVSSGATWAYPAIQGILPASNAIKPEDADDLAWLTSVGQRTKAALQGFNLQAKLLKSKLTPNAALLTFQGSANLTVDQVLKKQVEFKTTYGLSLVSVRPEAGAISLAIERPQRQLVRLEDIWSRWQPSSDNGNQDLAIAIREDNGEILMLSPQKNAPHSLIAGSTGSGKSVLVQNIILCIAATNTPAQAQIVLIDPKQGVDYFALEPLPHIKGGRIIDERETALEELNALVDEMEARYKRFKAARAANITAYNKNVGADDRLPVIWLIHDEFADWMQVEDYKQQVTAIVARLGVKARAAGIYLVFAAQRPEANVMPMQLRANLGNRLILRVDSEGTSEIALSAKGAERLLGKGHMLARLEGHNDLVYGQVPYLQEEVIEALVRIISS